MQLKALKATEWTFDLKITWLHNRVQEQDFVKVKWFHHIVFQFLPRKYEAPVAWLNSRQCAVWRHEVERMSRYGQIPIDRMMSCVATSFPLFWIWLAALAALPSTDLTSLTSLFKDLCFAEKHVETMKSVVGRWRSRLWCCPSLNKRLQQGFNRGTAFLDNSSLSYFYNDERLYKIIVPIFGSLPWGKIFLCYFNNFPHWSVDY